MKGLLEICAGLGLSLQPQIAPAETLNEINYKVNDWIQVLSSYYGAISKSQKGDYLMAQASDNVLPGDMLMLIVATSVGIQSSIPDGFSDIINTTKSRGDLTMRIAFKLFSEGDPGIYKVEKTAKSYFVSLLTIRGASSIVDGAGRVNTAGGNLGLAITPRIHTEKDGALVACFAYDDPHKSEVINQHTIVSIKNDGNGLAVGISPTEGGISQRVKALSNTYQNGSGDDIAVAISIL